MMNICCVICAELFLPSDDICCIPCGHLFHKSCLMRWFQNASNCPQCRNKCRQRDMVRTYFNFNNDITIESDSHQLQNQNDNYKLQINLNEKEITTLKNEIQSVKEDKEKVQTQLKKAEDRLLGANMTIALLKEQCKCLTYKANRLKSTEDELEVLKKEMADMTLLKNMLSASTTEAETIYNSEHDIHHLRIMLSTLKRELQTSEYRRQDLKKTLDCLRKDLRIEHALQAELKEKVTSLECEVFNITNEKNQLESDLDLAKIDLESISGNQLDASTILDNKRRKLNEINGVENSPTLAEKTESNEKSDSPYLLLKSCPIGYDKVIKINRARKLPEMLPKRKPIDLSDIQFLPKYKVQKNSLEERPLTELNPSSDGNILKNMYQTVRPDKSSINKTGHITFSQKHKIDYSKFFVNRPSSSLATLKKKTDKNEINL